LVSDRELSIVEDMLSEIEVYETYKKRLSSDIKKLEIEYQSEKYGYVAFKEKLDKLLGDKSEEDWIKYYNSYIYSLAKRIDKILAELFYQVYSDKRKLVVEQPDLKPASAEEPKAPESLGTPPTSPEMREMPLSIDYPKYADVRREIGDAEKMHELKAAELKKARLKNAVEPTPVVQVQAEEKRHFSISAAISAFFSRIRAASAKLKFPNVHFPKVALPKITAPKVTLPKIKLPEPKTKPVEIKKQPSQGIFSRFPSISALFRKSPTPKSTSDSDELIFSKGKGPFIEELAEMEKGESKVERAPLKSSEGIVFGWFSAKHLWDEMLGRFGKKQEPVISDETEVPEQMKKLREVRKKLYDDERVSKFSSTLLAQEAKRVRRILEAEKPAVYKGSSLGLIANVTVKKISLWLVDKFPEVFGILYNALRAANIKVLSNTYVNIMILIAAAVFIFLDITLTFFFFGMNYALYQIILRSFLISSLASTACIAIFFTYPFLKIKDRRKSITTNLPFAINHISSVAASGVPPTKMFELIAASSEYGEVAVEIRKIVDFITIFGYDFLTAVKAVAASTPSLAFKEFLEGLVSTIETGGDLDSFLKQKSEESALTYQLERQRYNESVSTYSDIYTGLLIAAPLFFIASLTMVNLLGGTIGGMGVDTLMSLCAYIAIPLLNIGFIVFLQMSQPEV
jgi:pilus assembly protein TadC